MTVSFWRTPLHEAGCVAKRTYWKNVFESVKHGCFMCNVLWLNEITLLRLAAQITHWNYAIIFVVSASPRPTNLHVTICVQPQRQHSVLVFLFFFMNLEVRHESAETRIVVFGQVFICVTEWLSGIPFHRDSDECDCLGQSDQTVWLSLIIVPVHRYRCAASVK